MIFGTERPSRFGPKRGEPAVVAVLRANTKGRRFVSAVKASVLCPDEERKKEKRETRIEGKYSIG